jgi:hypothetical protein
MAHAPYASISAMPALGRTQSGLLSEGPAASLAAKFASIEESETKVTWVPRMKGRVKDSDQITCRAIQFPIGRGRGSSCTSVI